MVELIIGLCISYIWLAGFWFSVFRRFTKWNSEDCAISSALWIIFGVWFIGTKFINLIPSRSTLPKAKVIENRR